MVLLDSFTYDVYLSFRGEDTRYGFAGNLYGALMSRGIHSFIDDRENKGEEITLSLLKAIEESRFAIIIFSEHYASSSFCLDELTAILDCYENRNTGLVVFPVFYGVDPSDIRKGRGSYGEALAYHEKRFHEEVVNKWRNSLRKAASLAGFDFRKGGYSYDYEVIEAIVKEVGRKVSSVSLHFADYPVGLESRVDKVKSLLNLESDDVVHMVGIHGIGGIGKTAIARAVYNSIGFQFEGLCFLKDVRENSMKFGLEHLQEIVLSELCHMDINIGCVTEGIPLIKETLHKKKVLLVLDDVDKLMQLQVIAGSSDWFGLGSRVIITTQDKDLLARHGVEFKRTYEVEELSEKEALNLLSLKDRYGKIRDKNIQSVGYKAVDLSFAPDQYEKIRDKNIQSILKLIFDSFLFFNGCKLVEVEDILGSHYGLSVKDSIGAFIAKSIIKFDSRLWLPQDAVQALQEKLGSSTIEILLLDFPNDGINSNGVGVNWDGQPLKKMQKLASISKPIKVFKSLIVLDFSYCEWIHNISDVSGLPNLQEVYFSYCENLTQIHESVGFLEKLRIFNVDHCKKLRALPPLRLTSLEQLDLSYCSVLESFPEILGRMENVTGLYIIRSPIKELPYSIQNLVRLRELELHNCGTVRLPNSIVMLSELSLVRVSCQRLSFSKQDNGEELESKSAKTEHLILSYCNISNDLLPIVLTWFANVKYLDLSGNSFEILHARIKECPFLRNLNLDGCENIEEIEGLPWKLESLSAKQCTSLKYLDFTGECPSSIRTLILDGCSLLYEVKGVLPNLDSFSAKKCTSLNNQSRSMIMNQITAERPQKDQSKVLSSSIISSTQLRPPFTDVRKGPNPKLIVPAKIFPEDVTGETSKRLPEEETIPNDHLVIQSCSEGDDIEQKAVSSSELESEESTFNTESEVFYGMDPSDVRNERGSYGEALAKHEERLKDDIESVNKWRTSPWDGYKSEVIESVVKKVYSKVSRVSLHVADYPVGLESRMDKINSLLNLGSDDVVHMVGIHGIGGIGKTTIARALHNSIRYQFEGLCFLEDVRENSMKFGLEHLQETMLSKIYGDEDINIQNAKEVTSMMREGLRRKKILLILDDVDKMEQLQAIAGASDWFGPGSRVIITTRDKNLLVSHAVERSYEVEALSEKESLDLLSWNAFKTNKIDPCYANIAKRVLTFASGLPLALRVVGSFLFGRSTYEWSSVLDKVERIPIKQIQTVLKISYDSLEEEEKRIFLDIACFFNGQKLGGVKDILSALYGASVKYSIEELIEKSLIKIDDGFVTLHNLIQDMGREIVRQESPLEPGKRSRLWFPQDVVHVLQENSGSSTIESLFLDFPKDDVDSNRSNGKEVCWDGNALTKMQNLRMLVIKSGSFSKGPAYLPNSLKVLKWLGYPSPLPNDFHPKELAILELPASFMVVTEQIQRFISLKVLNFSNCELITRIPDVSGVPNLENLSFRACPNLSKIHESVGFLDKLTNLDASHCKNLKTFPPIILTSLEQLNLSHCSALESFPEILGKMENLTELRIIGSPIKNLPFSIQNLNRLQNLELQNCGMVQLPSSIKECYSLRNLKLDDCVFIQEITVLPLKLETFSAKRCKSLKYMVITEECRSLRELILDDCIYLREIKGILQNLDHFSAKNCRLLTSQCASMLVNQEMIEAGNKMFFLPGTKIPDWFSYQTREELISFWYCNKFPAISLCLVIGLVDEQPISVKFSPKVFVNGNELSSGNQIVYEFRIATDHILLFDARLLKFEDNGDSAFSDKEWKHVTVSYEDLITDNGVPIRRAAKYRGIHVFNETIGLEDIQFICPWQTLVNANLDPNSMLGPTQRGKILAIRPQEDQTMAPSHKLTSTQSPSSEAETCLVPQPTFPVKMPLGDVGRETSESLSDNEVYAPLIHNEPPVIQRCSDGDSVELEAVSCEEEFSFNTEGSDSDDPFDLVNRKLCVSGKETISSGASSGDENLRSIKEAINALEGLMATDLSEVSTDPAAHSKLHQLLDLLSASGHPKVTVEVKEAIVEFKRKAFESFREFQATIESVNKLKNYEKHLARIQQEAVAGKDQRKHIKNARKRVSLDIEAENSRKKELESEIAILRIQLSTKERDLEQLDLNVKNQETILSTYSTTCASLNEHAQALLEEANDLLATSSGIQHDGEAAEVEQSRLNWTWSIDLTGQLNKMKKNILGFL